MKYKCCHDIQHRMFLQPMLNGNSFWFCWHRLFLWAHIFLNESFFAEYSEENSRGFYFRLLFFSDCQWLRRECFIILSWDVVFFSYFILSIKKFHLCTSSEKPTTFILCAWLENNWQSKEIVANGKKKNCANCAEGRRITNKFVDFFFICVGFSLCTVTCSY